MQEPVHATQVDEGPIVGDVLDHAFQHLALLQVGDQLVACLAARLLEHRPSGDDDVVASGIHLEDLERLRRPHERVHVLHRADVDLTARQEGDRARQIDDEAALDPTEDGAGDPFVALEGRLELRPGFLAAGLLAAQADDAVLVLIALDEHVDGITELDRHVLARRRELLQGDLAFRLETHVDEHHVVLDVEDGALQHPAFEAPALAQGLVEQLSEVLLRNGRRRLGGYVDVSSHALSFLRPATVSTGDADPDAPPGCHQGSARGRPASAPAEYGPAWL